MKYLLSLLLVGAVFFLYPTNLFAQAGPTSCAQTSVNVADYVAPRCESGNPCSINASSITTSERHIGNVQNSIEWVTSSIFKQNSNEIHFLYELTGSSINFLQDTIWNPFVCTNGKDAMYRVYDGASSNWGAQLLPIQMSCGAPHVYQARIQPLEYDAGVETNVTMPLNQCTVNGQGTQVTTNTNELFFQGVAECNGNKNLDIIGIRNTGGAGAGEVYFYCKGYGLCAWYQELNFAAPGNNPRSWNSSTDVCDLKAGVADYYLYPISGLEKVSTYNVAGSVVPQNEVTPISGEIFSNLVDQGYQAYCTTPTFNIKGGQDGEVARFQELFANNPTAGVFDITSALSASADKATYPLFRNSGEDASLMSSLEHYWGYQEIAEDKTLQEQTLNSAPIYKLLSQEQQCEQKVAILKSIENLCGKLEDPKSCALYQPVPGYPRSSTETLLAQFMATGVSCKDVGNNNIPASAQEAVNALMNTPLYLDKAYRLAFLVINVPLQGYQTTTYFNFLRIPSPQSLFTQGSAQPANDIRVLAFRIPDIGTNKNPDDSGFYEDPLQLTNNVLSSPEQIKDRYQKQVEAKSAIKSGGDQQRLKCALPEDLGAQTACQDPLSKAVIDLVNKQPNVTGPIANGVWGPCDTASQDNLEFEKAGLISDEAGLGGSATGSATPEEEAALAQVDAGVTFKPSFNLLKSLFSRITGQENSPQEAEFNFISKLDLHQKSLGPESKVQMYLVYPVGYELEDVETTLAGLIFSAKSLEEYYADPELVHYFAMSGFEAIFQSEEESVEFFDPAKCDAELRAAAEANPPRLPNLDACKSKATAKAVDTESYDRQPRVLGGVLGNLMRKIQLSISEYGTATYNYIASCETTEQFLTGNCSGGGVGETEDGVNTSGLTPLAQCKMSETGRITSGETATHIPSSSNPACYTYEPGTHNIPNWLSGSDPAKDCDFLSSYVSCTYPKSLIANFVDSSGKFAETGSETACQYIVRRAREANVSPRFALAMWGEESGFSGTDAWDLGVVSQPKKDLGAQMDAFINLVNIYRGQTDGFERFLLRYSGEGAYGAWTPGTPFCNNKFFPGRLRTYYDYLAP